MTETLQPPRRGASGEGPTVSPEVELTVAVPISPMKDTGEKQSVAEVKNTSQESPNNVLIFEPLIVLGEGSYSTVYLATNPKTGLQYAVKRIPIGTYGISSLCELTIMQCLRHPSLQSAHNIIIKDKHINIVQDLAVCNLSEWSRLYRLSDHCLRLWTFQLVCGLWVLHSHGILHGDIKGANVLVHPKDNIPRKQLLDSYDDSELDIRLADYSLACYESQLMSQNKVCTETHRPLEVWIGRKWDLRVDVWALGCTLFEMAFGRRLFRVQPSPHRPHQKQQYIKNLLAWEDEGPLGYYSIRRFLATDSHQSNDVDTDSRMGNLQYSKFRLPDRYYRRESLFRNLLERMLIVNMDHRPTIFELIEHPYFEGLTKPIASTLTYRLMTPLLTNYTVSSLEEVFHDVAKTLPISAEVQKVVCRLVALKFLRVAPILEPATASINQEASHIIVYNSQIMTHQEILNAEKLLLESMNYLLYIPRSKPSIIP